MYPRTRYIKDKIERFQKLNPKRFHRQIYRSIYELYAPIINDIKGCRLNQIGGINYKNKRELQFIQKYEKYKFKINIEKTKYDILINILTFEKDNPRFCAIINVERDVGIAYLANMSYYKECTIPDLVGGKGGSTILNFLLKFIKKNKQQLGINRIVLKDNSIKPCNTCPYDVEFSSMYFLLKNNTWYGSYGFRPFNMRRMEPDKRYIKLYEQNQKKISQTKVGNVNLSKYIVEAINEYNIVDIDQNKILRFIKLWEDKQLSQFLRVLMREYDKYCCIFEYVQRRLFQSMGLQRFYGFDFYLDI